MEFVLAVDVGTQSLKACIIDRSPDIIEESRVPYDPDTRPGKKVENRRPRAVGCVRHRVRRFWSEKKRNLGPVPFPTLCPSLLPMGLRGRTASSGDPASGPEELSAVDVGLGSRRRGAISRNGRKSPDSGRHFIDEPFMDQAERAPLSMKKRGVIFGHVVSYFMKKLTGTVRHRSVERLFYRPVRHRRVQRLGRRSAGKNLRSTLENFHPSPCPRPSSAPSTSKSPLRRGCPKGDRRGYRRPTTPRAPPSRPAVTRPGSIMNTTGTVEIMVLCMDRPLVSKDHLIRTHAYPDRWLHMRTVGAGRSFHGVVQKDVLQGYVERDLL